MHDETIAIHGGYTADGTRAVAVPIYQTVAHDFIDAEHAGAVLDLEMPGFHYNRINNPTNDVLEKRMAALEGGTAALVAGLGHGRGELLDPDRGPGRVQLRGGPPALRGHVHLLRPRAADPRHRGPFRGRRQSRVDRTPDRRQHLRRLLRDDRQSGRQRRRPRGGGRRRPPVRRAPHRRQHRRHPADAEADPTTVPTSSCTR